MHYVIIDCGAIGLLLARHLTASGHHVVGLVRSAPRLAEVAAVCAEAAVAPVDDPARLGVLTTGADAAIIATTPRLRVAGSRRERAADYRRELLGVVRVVAAVQPRMLLLSSMVVYGDGGDGDAPVTEHSPLTTALEPAAQSYGAAERTVLESRRGVVLRLADVAGQPGDPDDGELIRFAHQHLGGAVPFAPDALLHRVDHRDAAAAAAFAIDHDLFGVYNAVPDSSVPATLETVFGKLSGELGLPPLRFTGEVRTPTRAVSSAKLRAAGFSFGYA